MERKKDNILRKIGIPVDNIFHIIQARILLGGIYSYFIFYLPIYLSFIFNIKYKK